MLHEVLLLLGHNLSDGESASYLTRAKRAFGEEWFQPTLATIMAMVLLSLYLSEQLAKAGNQVNSPSFAPPIVQGLLETAHQWLHSYRNYDHLSVVNGTKINSLLTQVHTLLPCDHCVPPEPVTAEMHRPSTSSHPVQDTGASSNIGSVSSDHVAFGTSSPPPSPPSGLLPPPHQFISNGRRHCSPKSEPSPV